MEKGGKGVRSLFIMEKGSGAFLYAGNLLVATIEYTLTEKRGQEPFFD